MVTLLLMDRFAAGAFWPGYWGNLMATVAGVAVGIPAGLALNRAVEGSRLRNERVERAESTKRLIRQVGVSVEDNLRMIANLLDDKGPGDNYQRFDTATWDALAPEFLVRIAETPGGEHIGSLLAQFYRVLGVIQVMLDQRFASYFAPNPAWVGTGQSERLADNLETAIRAAASRCQERGKLIPDLLSTVASEIRS